MDTSSPDLSFRVSYVLKMKREYEKRKGRLLKKVIEKDCIYNKKNSV